MDIEKVIRDAAYKAALKEAQRLDDFLIKYFGSREEALQQAADYVIEEYPEPVQWENRGDNVIFWTETTYRIRRKTPEEKSLETNLLKGDQE